MDDYKSMVEAFVTYPWQEDDEIYFVRLIAQYWGGNERNAAPQFWRDYIRRLVKINPQILKSQTTSDKFINDLNELIETDKGVFATRLSEALNATNPLRFETMREAQDFAGNSHAYYYLCDCGRRVTCRCSQHKTPISVGSCSSCDGTDLTEGTYASDSDANIGGGIAGSIDPRIKQQGETAIKRLKLKARGKNELPRPIIKRA